MTMEIKANASQVLMSDVLKGQVPALDDAGSNQHVNGKHVIVVAERTIGAERKGLVGILRGMLFDADPEVEIRIDLSEALDLMDALSQKQLSLGDLELHHDERVITRPGPFAVQAARMDDISAQDQLCTVSLQLKKLV